MKLSIISNTELKQLVRVRKDEIKLGERVQTINPFANLISELNNSSAKYVLLGLPEDIGVRANLGRGGAYSAWQPALNTILNTQSNDTLTGEELLVLGHVDFSNEMEAVKDFNFHEEIHLNEARKIVSTIDDFVGNLIDGIVTSGKEPVIIGGGHNNSFPNLKGAAIGLHQSGKIKSPAINCINCDAHSDLRPLEGRHSGNGFSYAINEGYLKKYSVIGLQEIFNSDFIFKKLDQHKDKIHFTLFEDIFVREKLSFSEAVNKAIEFVADNYAGLEIDLDTIQNIPSSAKTSSGISTVEARKYVYRVASSCKIAYFHIAEAAPVLSHIKTDLKTGKLIAYLVTDYLKARNEFKKN